MWPSNVKQNGWAHLSLGAGLMLASCAAPPLPQSAGGPHMGLTSIDGANVALASFQNSAFPYHGLIPNYQETGQAKPFLDVNDNGRLGHTSPRGGLLWEDQTYNDRTVLLAAPQNFNPSRPGVIVVYFHGNSATLERDVIARQQIVRQLADSGLNGVLVAPQLAVDAPDSSAGKFWSPGGFAAFLDEAERKLGEFYPSARNSFRRMPVVIVAYSGGYLPAVYSLAVGGADGRVRGLVLLDALYGERDKFVSWVEGPGRNAFFLSAYSVSSREGNAEIKAELEQAGLKVENGLPAALSPGEIAFVDAGSVDHGDFVTSAWGGAPLKDIFSRIR
ncbi:MAG: alpha/beta hydrolase [Hyphomicrobiales bacterium]|nr:alpha/beta hydrolase [Hyphomicrobiales bacterium]